MNELLAAATPKLFTECNVLEVKAKHSCMMFYLPQCSHLTCAHSLVLVEEENRNPGSRDHTKNGVSGQVDFRNMSEPGITLDTDAGVNEDGGRNEEIITITALDWYTEIWFARFLFSSKGTYSDYDGRVTLTTNNGDDMQVPLTSTENKHYLLIAKLTNGPDGPTFSNLNKAVECEELDPILKTNMGCFYLQPKTAG